MKRYFYFLLSMLIIIRIFAYGQTPRVDTIRNLFAEDIGERENLFFEILGAGGGVFGCPAWSSDGKMVAFCFSCRHPSPQDENDKLCIFNLESKELKIVSSLNDLYPSWWPDSLQLVFNSDRTGSSQIYKINMDGTNLVQLTSAGENAGFAVCSPVGGKIAYVSRDRGIWTMNSNGTGATQISFHPRDGRPSWSPDGLRIAFQSSRGGELNIWVMNADGSNAIQITQKGGALPSWSPDGHWISFERDKQIWLVTPDGNKEVHLRTNFPVGAPSWSPDSRKIVFEGMKDFRYDADLYVMTIKY